MNNNKILEGIKIGIIILIAFIIIKGLVGIELGIKYPTERTCNLCIQEPYLTIFAILIMGLIILVTTLVYLLIHRKDKLTKKRQRLNGRM